LINTIRFYILYSGIIEFDYNEESIIDPADRTVIDKWILSKMNSVKKKYFQLMDEYEITKATRVLYDFTIDELSNWYIRRNRKRLRNPGNESDKLSGYQTLYEVIIELLQMVAPFSPFLSEKLYTTLKNENNSIHLSEFSDVNESIINTDLEEEMKLAQDIVYLVRSIRVKNNLKVRQPLKQILIPVLEKEDILKLQNIMDIILEEVNVKELNIIEGDSDIIVKKSKPNFKSIGPKFGKDVKKVQKLINELSSKQISELEKSGKLTIEGFEFTKDDIEIFTNNIEGWIVETYGGITVALDTKLDKDLIDEGIVREFINRIQNSRRSNDLKISDSVRIFYRTSENIRSAINKNLEYIKSETMSENITSSKSHDYDFSKSEINGELCELYLEKLN